MAVMVFDSVPAQERSSVCSATSHATKMSLALAAGEVSEESLTRWIRDYWPKA